MKRATDIFNETIGSTRYGYQASTYFEKDGKLVRFSDHASKTYNMLSNNEGTSEILLVFVNAGMTESEMQENVNEIAQAMDAYVDYAYFDENDSVMNDVESLKSFINIFLT